MKKSRLFEMTLLLMERKHITAAELARHFEVSQRTVYRDVDALCAAGIPVYAKKGANGGIRIMEQFVLERILLNTREQDEILFALGCLSATEAADDGKMLAHMRTLFNRENTDWLEVDFSDWGEEEGKALFPVIKDCILARRVLSFTYYGANGESSTRRVEPYKLRFKTGNWYLEAWCESKSAMRLFRLSRMEDLKPEEEFFEARRLCAHESDGHTAPVSTVALKLRFKPEAAFRVHDSFRPSAVAKNADGSFDVNVEYPNDSWLYGFLLSFGSSVEVLSPAYVSDALCNEAKKLCALYNS